jgi:hypothetical protein
MIQFTLTDNDNLTGILCGWEPLSVFSGYFWKGVMLKEYKTPVDSRSRCQPKLFAGAKKRK